MSERLQIRFVGDEGNIKPAMVRAHELALVIDAYEDAIASAIVEENPDLKIDTVRVSLVEVKHESIGLAFESNLPLLSMPAATRISNAINNNAYSKLSKRIRDNLRTIVAFARRHQCDALLSIEQENQVRVAILTPDTEIPATFDMVGETVLYGEVKRAGGIKPTIEFQTFDGKTLFCPTTSSVAIQLGRMLYQEVALRGNATWDTETYQLRGFEIKEVLGFRKIPLADALNALHQAGGHVFDTVEDVDNFVSTLRNDGDPD